jgi:ketosteroid isomerase-like protein
MTDQNIDIGRRHNALWNAGDMEGLRDLYDDEVVLQPQEGWPEPGPFVGRDAVFRQFERLRQDWQGERLEVLERRAQGDFVVTRLSWQARGRRSGAATAMTISSVLRLNESKIVAVTFYLNHAEALVAAGIQE